MVVILFWSIIWKYSDWNVAGLCWTRQSSCIVRQQHSTTMTTVSVRGVGLYSHRNENALIENALSRALLGGGAIPTLVYWQYLMK